VEGPDRSDARIRLQNADFDGQQTMQGASARPKGVIFAATHAGMTSGEFRTFVTDWLETARHPRFNRRSDDFTCLPMQEALAYLRANGFKTDIVSGGGVEFLRTFAEKAYGVPPEQVIGSRIKLGFHNRDGKGTLMREPAVDFVDDKHGKPLPSSASSVVARSRPSAIPTAIWRCYSRTRRIRVRGWA
jgi:hypothetical protein